MTTVNIRTDDGDKQLTVDYDRSQLFVGENLFENGVTITASGADISISLGQVLGRNTDGELDILKSASTDGSQLPVGIAASNYTILDGSSLTICMCISGRVDESLLVFDGTDTLDTVISSRSLRDRLKSDTAGIIPTFATQNTIADN